MGFIRVPEEPRRRGGRGSLQTESAGLFYSGQHFLVQHGEGGVRWQVKAIKTCVGAVETRKNDVNG